MVLGIVGSWGGRAWFGKQLFAALLNILLTRSEVFYKIASYSYFEVKHLHWRRLLNHNDVVNEKEMFYVTI